MAYPYDVFISYSSQDRPWALKLEADLQQRGLRVFLDRNRLEAGNEWQDQLRQALDGSQHLLVLWSGKSRDSAWVQTEIVEFRAKARSATAEEVRLILFIPLDNTTHAYPYVQAIVDVQEANLYARQPTQLTNAENAVWDQAIGKLVNRANDTNPAIRVPLAIVSMTSADVTTVDPEETLGGRTDPPRIVLPDLGIPDIAALAHYYGRQRHDWCPTGSTKTIGTILDEVLGTLNTRRPGQPPLRWEEVEFISADIRTEASSQVSKLLTGPSLVVIDSLSFYCRTIYYRLSLLNRCFESRQALVLVLGPFDLLPQRYHTLRSFIRRAVTGVLDFHYDPESMRDREYASCSVNICDAEEVDRLLRSHVRTHAGRPLPTAGPAVLRIT